MTALKSAPILYVLFVLRFRLFAIFLSYTFIRSHKIFYWKWNKIQEWNYISREIPRWIASEVMSFLLFAARFVPCLLISFSFGKISPPDERDQVCVSRETATRFALFWSFIAFMGNKIFMYQMKRLVVKSETRTWRSEIRNLYNFYIRLLRLVNPTSSARIAARDQIQFTEASIIGTTDEREPGIP